MPGAIAVGCFALPSTLHAFTEEKWVDAVTQPAAKLNEQLRAMLTRYGVTTVVDTASLPSNIVAQV